MEVENLTDETIADLVRTSDKEMFVYIVRRYENKLTRYVHSYTRNLDDTTDVVQTTFIKAYENLNSFNIKMKFSSWIYRIAHNEAINKIKKEGKSITGIDPDIFERMLEEESKPDTDYEKESIKKDVLACINSMPLKYKDALTLYYIEDKKYEEISDILKVPSGTIATWINRGKKLLKEKCQNLK